LIYESKRTSKDAADQHDPGQEEDLFIKVENFRPNLIVSSSSSSLSTTPSLPHQEDHWKSLTLPVTSSYENEERTHQDQEIVLAVTGPCSRCSMVNVNGKSGVMSCRVFEALKEYRKVNSHVYFGQFLSFQSFLLSSNNREDNNSNSEEEDIRLSVGVPIKID
jgi:molybdenum cofactor sulfurtransferase